MNEGSFIRCVCVRRLKQVKQTYQVSRISRETPAFWSHLPLTRHLIKISRISSIKFGQLILSKMVATRCHILRLKCTKFKFGWGSAPDPASQADEQHSPDIYIQYTVVGFQGYVLLLRGENGLER